MNRITVRLSLGLFLTLSLLWVYLRISPGDVKQRIVSPDGRFVAQVRELHNGSAVDADYLSVQLREKWNPFGHDIYGGLDYGIEIAISWVDSKNLLVTCTNCVKLGQGFKEDQWHEVTVHYVAR
jgi:hypothetical protein